MRHLGVGLLFFLSTIYLSAQTVAQANPTSDAQALSLAQQSVNSLTGGVALSDVTLNASIVSILGSDNESGTGTFQAKGNAESRVDLSVSSGIQSDVRSASNGIPAGAWIKAGGSARSYAQHNCWTDAPWFFPAFSSLAQTGNQNFIFKYVGQEQHLGVNTQHIQVFQSLTSFQSAPRLSTMDFYLDPVSLLPLAIAFNSHADANMNVDIPVEVLFANYQAVNGVQVPFHFQQMFSGSVILDATLTNVSFNTGLPDSLFNLP